MPRTHRTPRGGAALFKYREQTRTKATPGVTSEFKIDTDLRIAMLIAEMGHRCHHLVGAVVNINEGREIAKSSMRRRMRHLERGGTPACPECYLAWTQGIDGDSGAAKKVSL